MRTDPVPSLLEARAPYGDSSVFGSFNKNYDIQKANIQGTCSAVEKKS